MVEMSDKTEINHILAIGELTHNQGHQCIGIIAMAKAIMGAPLFSKSIWLRGQMDEKYDYKVLNIWFFQMTLKCI